MGFHEIAARAVNKGVKREKVKLAVAYHHEALVSRYLRDGTHEGIIQTASFGACRLPSLNRLEIRCGESLDPMGVRQRHYARTGARYHQTVRARIGGHVFQDHG